MKYLSKTSLATFYAGVLTSVFLAIGGARAEVELDVQIGKPILKANAPNTTFVKVGLMGIENARRPQVNIAIVLDKSESMTGEGILRAKEAAKWAVDQLNDQDVACLITYDSSVRVLVPATRVTDKELFKSRIDEIVPGGKTALFAGISKGAAEVRKFLDRRRVNRVVLLSDGKANIGPNSPGDLGDLGRSLLKEGISVTTIGLGLKFHEDLMERLANKSDGNHIFVEEASALGAVFNEELGDVFSVVAQDVDVEIFCAPGVRPLSVLGREADIIGNRVTTNLNQIYSNQEKYVLLEVEVSPGEAETVREVASVRTVYDDLFAGTSENRNGSISVQFTDDASLVEDNVDKAVMVACITQKATITNRRAVELRDVGQVEAAKELLTGNWNYLRSNATKLDSEQLNSYAAANGYDMRNVDNDETWPRMRKGMRAYQFSNERQQRLVPLYGQQNDLQVQQEEEENREKKDDEEKEPDNKPNEAPDSQKPEVPENEPQAYQQRAAY